MDKLDQLRTEMNGRFDKAEGTLIRVEEKLDVYGERSVRNETSIAFIRGHLKVSTAFFPYSFSYEIE